jgi:hypothetical protein
MSSKNPDIGEHTEDDENEIGFPRKVTITE